MSRQPLQIGLKSDASQSPFDSVERLVNCYVETAPQGREANPVYGTPGLRPLASASGGPGRMAHVMDERLFTVNGTTLNEISAAGIKITHGSVDAGGTMDVDDDGTNLVIVNSDTGLIWVYSDTGGLQQVTDSGVRLAQSVMWLDGYFIFGQKDSQVFFISNLADPLHYDALNYASAEWRPDLLLKVMVSEKNVYMLCSEHIEAWYNTGNTASFVYSPRPDVHIPIGIAGTFCAVYTNQAIFFLAHDLTVRRLDGLVPTRISTTAQERIIAGAPEINQVGWSDPSKTVVTAHVWRGHLNIVFNNPDGCIVFDQATGLWHERETYTRTTWAGSAYAYAYNQHVMCDPLTDMVYTLQPDQYDDFGTPLIMDCAFPFFYQQATAFIVNEVELVVDTGRGALGVNGQVLLSRSNDGYTWSSWRSRSMGLAGEYGKRITFNNFGRSRGISFRAKISDPVPRVLLGAYIDAEPLA